MSGRKGRRRSSSVASLADDVGVPGGEVDRLILGEVAQVRCEAEFSVLGSQSCLSEGCHDFSTELELAKSVEPWEEVAFMGVASCLRPYHKKLDVVRVVPDFWNPPEKTEKCALS